LLGRLRICHDALKLWFQFQAIRWATNWSKFCRTNVETKALLMTFAAMVFVMGIAIVASRSMPIVHQSNIFDASLSALTLACILISLGLMDVRFRQYGLDLDDAMDPSFQNARASFLRPVTVPARLIHSFAEEKISALRVKREKEIATRARLARHAEIEASRPAFELRFEEVVDPFGANQKMEKLPTKIKKQTRPSQQNQDKRPKTSLTKPVQQEDLFASIWDGDPQSLWQHLCDRYAGEPVGQSMVKAILARAKNSD
jgi:hypothetical protein